jgi:hypothetical protein
MTFVAVSGDLRNRRDHVTSTVVGPVDLEAWSVRVGRNRPRRIAMSVLARFTPRSLTVQKYEEVNRRLEESGDWPAPDGLEIHVLFGPDDNLRVSEIWDSQEQLDAFGERLMPVLADVGIEPGEPELLEVRNIVKH